MNEPQIACSANRATKIFKAYGYHPDNWQAFGPAGFTIDITLDGRGSVIVSQSDHEDGNEWLHASIAFQNFTPRYIDLTTLKEAVFGPNRYAYQVFAPDTEHVNIHEHALHLWGRADGKPALPNFGRMGTI